MSCAVRIRFYCDCAPSYLAYFPSRLSRLTNLTFSTFILTDYSQASWAGFPVSISLTGRALGTNILLRGAAAIVRNPFLDLGRSVN